jgi:hypothetical protein
MNTPRDTWFPRPMIARSTRPDATLQAGAGSLPNTKPATPATPIRPQQQLPTIPDLRLNSRDQPIAT